MASTELWERVRRGEHTALIGHVDAGEAPDDVLLLEVDCDLGGPPLRPLISLCERVEALLGDRSGDDVADADGTHMTGGLRHRIAAQSREPMHTGRLVGTLNRLASATARPVAVWFHAADAADPATQSSLLAALRESSWLKLPVIVALESGDGEFVASVREILGADDTIDGTHASASIDMTALPEDAALVLRAGAVVGNAFEADTVAELLDVPMLHILEALQLAHDNGVPVRDRGRGVFSLPSDTADAVRRSVLPSLRQAWHARLADLLGTPAEQAAEPATPGETRPESGTGLPDLMARAPSFSPPPSLHNLGDMLGRPASARPPSPEEDELLEKVAREAVVGEPVEQHERARDAARAARHAQMAGRIEDAVAHTLAVADDAAHQGAYDQAWALADDAARQADALPRGIVADILRARVELERARIAWLGVGESADLTLNNALDHLARAQELVHDDHLMTAEILATAAAVRFDLGDPESLEEAIDNLTHASLLLAENGRAIEAARLLNDQAAIWVRLGDPVRAYHLLVKSREVFQRLDSPVAELELAETEHQTARLALHAEARPGRERDAILAGLDHADRAAKTFERLNLPRQTSRVWETMGRLSMRGGRLDDAASHLENAFAVQRRHADGVGLARTTAALSELFVRTGDRKRALVALVDSVELNIAKGSPIGLAFNLQSLQQLAQGEDLPGLANLRKRIEEAQQTVGVVDTPDAISAGPQRLPESSRPGFLK